MASVGTETQIEYSIAGAATILRLYCRWKYLGFKGWGIDDYFAISAFVWYTFMLVGIELVLCYGAAAGFTTVMREALTPAEVASFRKGEIVMFVSFYDLMLMNWSLKASLLGFYHRMAQDTRWHIYVKCVAGWAVITFFAAVFTETFHCMPIHHNWQVLPNPGMECSAGIITNIVIATGNVSTDALLLGVPFLMLKDLQISLFRKFKIGILCSLGLVVIAMSLLRCILTVSDPKTVASSSIWATREIFVATIAINAPILNVIFKRETWTPKSTTKNSAHYGYSHESSNSGNNGPNYRAHYSRPFDEQGKIEIYKVTDIETSSNASKGSKESTKELVDQREENWPPGAIAPLSHFSREYPKVAIV